MAKISAYGEKEHARWRDSDGGVYVLTRKLNGKAGRLLHKSSAASTYTVRAKKFGLSGPGTIAEALEFCVERLEEVRGCQRV